MTTSPVRATPQAERRSAQARATATAAEATRPLPQGHVRSLARFLADVWRKSDRDRLLGLAGENAFLGVLTVFPALLVVAAVLGQLSTIIGKANADKVESSTLDALNRLFADSAEPAVDTAQHLFETSGNTLTLASALALVSLATAFAGIINTVTITYDVHDRRGWWKRRALGLAVGLGSVLAGAVVVTLIVVGPLFGKAQDIVASVGLDEGYDVVWSYARWPVAFVSLVVWATTLHHICPDRPNRWRDMLPGGLVTALLWLLASVGFNVYLTIALPRSPVLGALGGGLILMTWLYLLCLSLLIGGEWNAVRLTRRRVRGVPARPASRRQVRRARRRAVQEPAETDELAA